jgi:hypothetical protein
MISARMERYGHARLLLDSGAAGLVLLQSGNQVKGFGDGTVRTVNGSMACESTDDLLVLGKGTESHLPMKSCQSATVKPKDSEGILPTAVFKQIFISHAGSYAIINPARRLNVAREIAVVTPLSR